MVSTTAFNGEDYGGEGIYEGMELEGLGNYVVSVQSHGFVRCDMDISPELVGWIIGKNGNSIKELKNRTGCSAWVDQGALKLTITGADHTLVREALKRVSALISSAPISAGAVQKAVTQTIECPSHILQAVGSRMVIASVVKETRAQVVVNKKIGCIIVRGSPHSVELATQRMQAVVAACLQKANSGWDFENDSDSVGTSSSGGSGNRAGGVTSTSSSTPTSPSNTWSLFSTISFSKVSDSMDVTAPNTPNSVITKPKNAAPGQQRSSSLRTLDPSSHIRASSVNSDGILTKSRSSRVLVPPSGDMPTSTLHTSRSTPVMVAVPPPKEPKRTRTQVKNLDDLLAALCLDKYSDVFKQSEIDLEAAMLMADTDYKEMGIPKGPQIKIANALKHLQPV